MGVHVRSKVTTEGNVLVDIDDLIKSLYADLADQDNPKIKSFIKDSITAWENYKLDMLIQAGNRRGIKYV